jgi:replicative DNA helicase
MALTRTCLGWGASAFYQDRHRRIWQCIVRTLEMGKPADVVHDLRGARRRPREGWRRGLHRRWLAQGTPSALNIRRYADLVRDKGMQRQLAQAATEIAEAAMSPGTREIGQLFDEAETKIFALVGEQRARRRRAEGHLDAALQGVRAHR